MKPTKPASSSAEISAFVSARSLAFCALGATEKSDYLIDLITANYIPDLKAKILKRVAHSPVDISRKIISAVRGTLGQGAFLPYQSGSLRPIPELGNTERLCLTYTCAVQAVIQAPLCRWHREEMRHR